MRMRRVEALTRGGVMTMDSKKSAWLSAISAVECRERAERGLWSGWCKSVMVCDQRKRVFLGQLTVKV